MDWSRPSLIIRFVCFPALWHHDLALYVLDDTRRHIWAEVMDDGVIATTRTIIINLYNFPCCSIFESIFWNCCHEWKVWFKTLQTQCMMEVFFCLVKVSKTLLWLMLAVSLILNSLTIVVAFKITSYLAAGFHVSRAAMFWLSSFNPVFCVYADWPIVSHIVSFRNYESITCYLHNIKINREKVLFKLKSNNHSWYNKRREWKLLFKFIEF